MTASALFPVLAFIFGACIGSFLNVVIHRLPLGKSIVYPGSSCPACGNPIPAWFNVPILSYLMLRGRCHSCRQPFSIRYPLVEALTGLMALACHHRFGPGMEAVFWFTFISVLITISVIDIDHQIIPDLLSLPGIPVFAVSFLIVPDMKLMDTLLGILSGWGILYGVALAYYLIRKEEGMGGGDIKLLAMIGAATGWQGVLFTLFAGSVLGTLAGIVTMAATRILDVRLRIPFGPYLSAAALLYVFFGNRMILWYLTLIQR
jgi:leader peptidase (prepilin peptidase)/N-methyltransferase